MQVKGFQTGARSNAKCSALNASMEFSDRQFKFIMWSDHGTKYYCLHLHKTSIQVDTYIYVLLRITDNFSMIHFKFENGLKIHEPKGSTSSKKILISAIPYPCISIWIM